MAEALARTGWGGDAVVLAGEAAVIIRDITEPDVYARALAAAHQCGPDICSSQTTASAVGHPNVAMAQGRTFLSDALNSPVWGPDIAEAVSSFQPAVLVRQLT